MQVTDLGGSSIERKANATSTTNLHKDQSKNFSNFRTSSLTEKGRLHTLQYISPHKEELPSEYFKRRLNIKHGGLYLQSMTYRSQQVDQVDFEKYLSKMTEKLECLIANIVPFGNAWTANRHERKPNDAQLSKRLFDDIHFGKDYMIDA